ncbi:glycosyltransferase involved in cell wall biosynthesis [Chryseobacterium defluvii]|uniref:Glycosyltransferase involved in cell wall biosynthesis n=1 Tax=Chryseobacterium defluvii TaxID=160396 RepID=A0A840K9Q9_9FLAO|nr:glycosyltransferase family 2 protein [Chryseobacterium defluvii]MBB4804747.1 glycosyltransferase involved in cell wall biosynthesis [Chryseobacterium defluvii]
MDNSTPFFSVLMANFNRSDFIEEAIQSVLDQSYKNFELLIWDDSSSDDSIKIIKNFSDNRIRLFQNQSNKGAGFTKAQLAKNASGKISGFFDSDDVLDQSALEKMVQMHQLNPDAVLIYSNHFVCDEALKIIKEGSSRKILKGENHLTYFGISHFASYKTANYFLTEGIDETLTKAVDQDLYYKLEETGPSVFFNECLYYYRHNFSSISLNKYQKSAFEIKLAVMEKASERRENTSIKYPSKSFLKWLRMKNIEQKKWYMIPPFVSLNYILYLIKMRLKRL